MLEINKELFLIINAGVNPAPWVVFLARAAAVMPVFIAVTILIGLWIWGNPSRRGSLLAVGIGMIIAFLFTAPFAFFLYTPRPFVLGIGHTLIAHAPETSFPSDHATLIWTVAFGLIMTGGGGAWGWMLVLLGFATAWARIYLGVHFPFDMAGSFIIALLSASAAHTFIAPVKLKLLPHTERLYETTLRRFNLPLKIFPRTEEKG